MPFPFDITPSGYVILPVFQIFLAGGRATIGLFRNVPRCATVVFQFIRECESREPEVSSDPLNRLPVL